MENDHLQLFQAIWQQNLDQVMLLLQKDPSLIELTDDEGVPMTLLAAQTGNLTLVKYLVEYSRASMNITDTKQRNILHYGTRSGNVELCRYLVERVGMDVCQGDINRLTPFALANQLGNDELEDYYQSITQVSLAQMYQNPIRSGMYPDPSIVRVGEDYYMVNSSFIFFPCIPISHSRDLLHWQVIGHAITNPEWSQLGELEGGRGYWAPDISYHEGIFYITATYRLNDTSPIIRKQMVVTATAAAGPYGKPVFLDEDGIDPSIFHEDGKHYMVLNRGARIFEINQDGSTRLSEPQLLYYGDNKKAPEGPHLLKKDGFYYLFLAEGGTGLGHRITVARSTTLFGHYQPCPYNPIMIQSDMAAAIQRCGHGKPVCTQNGEWYMVYLCARMVDQKYSVLGRETALDPITWTTDGWPMINNGKGPSVLQKKPDLPKFDEGTVNHKMMWMFPREPEPEAIAFHQDTILLKGSKMPLSTIDARNILLRRQTDFSFICTVKVQLIPLKPEQIMGLTGYYDEHTWVCLEIGFKQGRYWIQVHEHIGDQDILHPVAELTAPVGEWVSLSMETRSLERLFSYQVVNQPSRIAARLSQVYYLCDEGLQQGKRFTGAMVGLFVYAGSEPLTGVFKEFQYDVIG